MNEALSAAELEAFTKEWEGFLAGKSILCQTPEDVGRFLATIRGLEAENRRLRHALTIITAGSPNRDAATVARQALENEARILIAKELP